MSSPQQFVFCLVVRNSGRFSNCRRLSSKQEEVGMNKGSGTRKGGAGRSGACGGTPRRDGSGGGTGNRNTTKQPPKKSK